ncbi:MAG TPA: glycosyltransferase family 39 protein [Candidatus Angelobacter sp.]|nr:glycosyltransferase family 39 protein [Candidatus Angelobacter sp.]
MPAHLSTSPLPTTGPDAAPATLQPEGRGRLARLWWLPGALAFALLRVPSFLEPHWYTDEAGYLTTGREMLSGKLPYSQVWNNKPPLHLATAGAVAKTVGVSETALHSVTFISGALALAALAYLARRLFRTWKAATAMLAAGALLGLPFFDAELFIPESLLIAATTWAAAIVITRLHAGRTGGIRWVIGAGVLAAVALAYQQTALADAAALGLILLVHPAARLRHATTYVATVVAATAAWVIPLVVLIGPHTLWFALVGFYLGDYNLSSQPGAHGPVLLALLALTVAFAVAGALIARRRRSTHPGWMLAVWAIATLCVPAAAQQPFAHFLTPALIPCVLVVVAVLPERRPSLESVRRSGRRLAITAPLAASLLTAALLARSAGVDWIPQGASQDMNGYRNLETYYAGAWQVATGRHSWTEWESEFDLRAPADTAVAQWLKDHGYSGARAVVWSSDAWPYLLADLPVLLPTAPIYNDQVLLGSNGEVTNRVRSLSPSIILTEADDLAYFSEIDGLLKSDYRQVFSSTVDTVYLRNDLNAPAS